MTHRGGGHGEHRVRGKVIDDAQHDGPLSRRGRRNPTCRSKVDQRAHRLLLQSLDIPVQLDRILGCLYSSR